MNRVRRDGDVIHAVYFYENDDHLEAVRTKFDAKRTALGCDVKLMTIQIKIGENLPTKLLEFVNENDQMSFDWLIMGSNGLSREKSDNDSIGSTASFIMQKCLVNMVIV